MDIKTLKHSVSARKPLAIRIVNQAVEVLLSTCGFDRHPNKERYESRFKKLLSRPVFRMRLMKDCRAGLGAFGS